MKCKSNILNIQVLIGVSLAFFVFSFQNCSNVEFTAQKDLNSHSDTPVDSSSNVESSSMLAPITNAEVIINNGDEFTNTQDVSILARADNATEVYLTEAFTCDQEGAWYPLSKQGIQRALEVFNDNAIIYARFRNAEGAESECVSDAIVHDSIAPVVSVVGDVEAEEITSKSDINLKIDIQEQGSGIGLINCQLSGQILPCLSLDQLFVSGLKPGFKNLRIEVVDRAGNKGFAELPWKVVAGLGLAGITINEGALFTKKNAVDLSLIAKNATSMRVSDDSSCKKGDLQPFEAARSYVLKNSNATNTVYAQFYNEAEEKTACLSASILHDNLPPDLTVEGAPEMAEKLHENFEIKASASDGGSGLKTLTCSLNGEDLNCRNQVPQTVKLKDEGVYTLRVVALDNLDIETSFETSFEYIKSIGDIGIHINNGDAYTNDPTGSVALQLEAVNAKEMYITNQAGCAQGGVWEAYAVKKDWVLSNLNSGSTSVYVKYRNTSSRVSACISASIIHDSTPYEIEYVNAPATLAPGESAELIYIVKEDGVPMGASEVEELKGCEIIKDDGDSIGLTCSEVGRVPLANLEEGNYTVYVTVADAASNETRKSHQFRVQEEIPKCSDPLLAAYEYVGECLALVDSFEREKVTGGDQFNWTSVIDDVARVDNHNVQANIFSHGDFGFGEASDEDKAVYVTGRLGGSVHDVYLISVPLDLAKFDKLKVEFDYLPIHLEKWKYGGKQGIEFVRLDICSASLNECGLGESIKASGLNSSYWQPVFTQKGYNIGEVTEELIESEMGKGNTGRNHTKETWLQGTATVDLNSEMVLDKSNVVFRITVKLDEGFEGEKLVGGKKIPDFNSDLKDGVGIDNVKAIAIQDQSEGGKSIAGTFD